MNHESALSGASAMPVDSTTPVASVPPLTDFARRALAARAQLALDDPDGEADAVAPLTPGRAGQIVWEHDVRAAAKGTGLTGSGHDRDVALLERLGADLTRDRGRVRCPAHGSTGKSIAWKRGDRRYIVHCFAGCTFDEIEGAA